MAGMEPPLVVLIPGTLCNDRLWPWREDLASLVDSVSVDLTAASVEGMAASVLSVSDRDLILVGCSLGGIVALAAHRLAPSRIAGMALLSTTARPPRAEQYDLWASQETLARDDFGRLCASLLPSLVRPDASDDLIETVLTMSREVGQVTYLNQLGAYRTRVDERMSLSTASCPVLAVAAEDDQLCPVWLHEEIAAVAPRGGLALVADSAHLSTLERPAEVWRHLTQWLAQNFDIPAAVRP